MGSLPSADYLGLFLSRLTLDNTELLFGLAVSSVVGMLQYIYSVLLIRHEKRGPFPLWMHTFYLAHDSSWLVMLLHANFTHQPHWFLILMPLGLIIWNAMELYCLYHVVTTERQAVFSAYYGKNPTLRQALVHTSAMTLVMYSIIQLGLVLFGEGCILQWFCLTNVVVIGGPASEWLERGSRRGLSIGLALVSAVGTVFTFGPFGFWVLGLPEVFDQPRYYLVGIVMTLLSLLDVAIVASYPPKTPTSGSPLPVW